jgi:hypothetical protein
LSKPIAIRPAEARPSSHQIGRNLEDQVENLLRSWGVQYRRAHSIVTSFGSRFTIDFWLPVVGERPPIVIEAKNFGVTAVSTANSRGRKGQEALYLLAHVRRHCSETRGARIILMCGAEKFSSEQVKFLSAELGPDFHVVPVDEPERLRSLVLQDVSVSY